jgi:transposase, IS5 family
MKAIEQLNQAGTGSLRKAGNETRKAVFIAEMKTVVPWPHLAALIEPFCPKKDNGWVNLAG